MKDPMLAKAEKYVGLPYIEGEFDCADLAAMVQWEVFGRIIALPARRRRPRGALGQLREIRALQADLADPIETPVTGCGALLWEPTENGQRWHIGTVFVAGGETWVLHNSFTMASALLQRLTDVRRLGAHLEGFYAWRDA